MLFGNRLSFPDRILNIYSVAFGHVCQWDTRRGRQRGRRQLNSKLDIYFNYLKDKYRMKKTPLGLINLVSFLLNNFFLIIDGYIFGKDSNAFCSTYT